MPAGLKRYWQSKGRKTGGGGKRRSTSTALVRQGPTRTVYKTRTRTVAVAAKRRSGSSGTSVMKREHGAGQMIPGPFRLKSAGIASLVGYSESGKGFAALQEFMVKLPTLGKLPKEAVAGLILNYFADRGEWVDAAAQAMIDIAGYKVGQAGFSISGDDDD